MRLARKRRNSKLFGCSYSASVEAAKTNISLKILPAITGHITQERGQLLAGRQLGGVSSQLRKHEASPLRLNSYDGRACGIRLPNCSGGARQMLVLSDGWMRPGIRL